jgi:hypothetical protein
MEAGTDTERLIFGRLNLQFIYPNHITGKELPAYFIKPYLTFYDCRDM